MSPRVVSRGVSLRSVAAGLMEVSGGRFRLVYNGFVGFSPL